MSGRADRPYAAAAQGAPKPNKPSVLPGARHPTKDVAGNRNMADGRERQVSGHQRLAVRRQLAQKTDPDTGRLLGVVFEAVVCWRLAWAPAPCPGEASWGLGAAGHR